jgi:hypothetical protein
VLLLSPSDRQSGGLAAKVFGYHGALGRPIGSRKRTELQTSRVSDVLYPAARPMLAVSRGRHQQPNAVADRRWHSLETIWWSIGWGT